MADQIGGVSPARIFARPTADCVWLGPAQHAALSRLSEPAELKLLLGPASSGKSTLLTYLAWQLQPDAVVLRSSGRKHDACALLSTLLLSAELAPWALEEVDQRNLLAVFIQQRRSQGKRVVVLIDDAHRLGAGAWQELDRLRRFRLKNGPAVELVLAGADGLLPPWSDEEPPNEILEHALPAATPAEIEQYVAWRLERHGEPNPFDAEAMQLLASLSDGRYAAVDTLCQITMLLLRKHGKSEADAVMVRDAKAMLSARRSARTQAAAQAPVHGANGSSQPCLLVCCDGAVLDRVPLGERLLIGRSQENDICLPSPYLSRYHALILGAPESYHIVDLNSVNGVLVNRRRVERARLAHDDVVTIGPFLIKVQLPGGRPASAPEEPPLESLAETAVMPPRRPSTPPMRRVK